MNQNTLSFVTFIIMIIFTISVIPFEDFFSSILNFNLNAVWVLGWFSILTVYALISEYFIV